MNNAPKKALALLFAVLMLALTACSSPSAASAKAETRTFTDSTGRTVEVPAKIDRIAVTGPTAQIVLYALCPDKLVGIAEAWTGTDFMGEGARDLPILGQLYGSRSELDLEVLLSAGAQLIIDVGSPKKTLAEDMDALQEQTGIPFVHVDAFMDDMGTCFRKLGELLDVAEEAEMLAQYCDKTYAKASELASSVEKKSVVCLTGEKGLNVIAKGSFHAEVIDLMADNAAVLEEVSSKGTGNEIDFEQLLAWDPEVLIITPGSVFDGIYEDPLLSKLSAVQNWRCYEIPFGPYSWIGFPPSVHRCLGMLWLGELLYPEATDYDLKEEVTEYYRLFFHYDLTPKDYAVLTERSITLASPSVQ